MSRRRARARTRFRFRGGRWRAGAALVLAGLAAAGAGADAPEDAALDLADRALPAPQVARDWHAGLEAAGGGTAPRRPGMAAPSRRLSVWARGDGRLAPGWRYTLADRLDQAWPGPSAPGRRVNTLQEAYLSWAPRPDRLVDAGRINLRSGVAVGYNPTDWFRAGALRSVVSSDPDSLRANRLGSVVLRAQALWGTGALSALWSPPLASRPDAHPFGLDLGATNGRGRWRVACSEAWSADFAPQFLVYGEAGRPPQVGVNATWLLGPATVAYAEWAGGRAQDLLSQARGLGGAPAFRSRLATGLTWTSAFKLSLTAEAEFDGAAPADAVWRRLGTSDPAAFAALVATAATLQDPPVRRRVFLRGAWQDAGVPHLDLSTNVTLDPVDASHQIWIESRYHWPRADAALQAQWDAGPAFSEFGSLPARRGWLALVTVFF